MGASSFIFSFFFLFAPGIFLLIASTAEKDWWDGLMSKGGDFLKDHGNTISLIVGATFTALGAILMLLAVTGGSSQPAGTQIAPAKPKRIYIQLSPRKKKKKKGKGRHIERKVYKGPGGGRYIKVKGKKKYI